MLVLALVLTGGVDDRRVRRDPQTAFQEPRGGAIDARFPSRGTSARPEGRRRSDALGGGRHRIAGSSFSNTRSWFATMRGMPRWSFKPGPVSCKCTVIEVSQSPIPPGGEARVRIGFTEATKQNDVLKPETTLPRRLAAHQRRGAGATAALDQSHGRPQPVPRSRERRPLDQGPGPLGRATIG